MFTRIVTRKNRQYLYAEERYRGADGKVKSRSRSLGPVGGHARKPGWLKAQFPPTHGVDWGKIEEEMLARMDAEDAKAKAFADKMQAAHGMDLKNYAGPKEKTSNPAAPSSS